MSKGSLSTPASCIFQQDSVPAYHSRKTQAKENQILNPGNVAPEFAGSEPPGLLYLEYGGPGGWQRLPIFSGRIEEESQHFLALHEPGDDLNI